MNRIERYCNLHFAFLRESTHPISVGHQNIVVAAEEFNGDGQVVRTWFVLSGTHEDGRPLPTTTPPHILVHPDIKPGEPSQPPIPGFQPTSGIGQDQLHRMKRDRDEQLAARERHIIYCREWQQHLATIAKQADRIKQLESSLLQADANASELSTRIADQASSINGLQSSLEASAEQLRLARKYKSFLHRVRVRVKWLVRRG